MTVICSNGLNAKRKFFNYVIDKIDGVLLGVFRIKFYGSDTGCVVYCGVLKSFDFVIIRLGKYKEFNIHLDVMTWNLFFVPGSFKSFLF